ncbi:MULTISPECIES: hypothetical protein [Hyphomonas]|jgi:hypothetical protein|nr:MULTISPECIES: hypothetical protein [unclassified Hyphomonas]MAN65539.1 hypothetical protein [Hyphomonadaceae bacterium]|tara:strand:+ start:5075 stop:5716 length:642 start_codon:yes stop_codon:yes gene_type:complete
MLLNTRILTPEGFAALSEAADKLQSKTELAWDYSIPIQNPVSFLPCVDRQGRKFIPKIGVKEISVVTPANSEAIPFKKWDIALTLEFEDESVHCPRWHFDMANLDQPGPITHLQYGGYKHAPHNHLDSSVQQPRWFTPPMDVILLCEVVAANFFQEIWIQSLRQERRWLALIHQSQKICYPHYLAQLSKSIGVSGANVLLDASWNDQWADRRP